MSNQTERVANKLINEKSPYLLQHAHNPVDWYPWGEAAFTKAMTEDKPIFLSIGYSTCHWCHVMEKESFEDEEVAEVLNNNFIAVKVDREERPDIDSVYMDFCQKVNGSGGWPLTVFLDPKDRRPFFVGTYFPKTSRYGSAGLMDVLDDIIAAWRDRRDDVRKSINFMFEEIEKHQVDEQHVESREELMHGTYERLRYSFDHKYGGFGHAPKFPTPSSLFYLQRYYAKYKEKGALDMITKTLDSMYKGGIFDHIGFGFSRYSTDERWLVPHFEKMLYDNALLIIAYTEAYQLTGEDKYRDVAEKIITYLMRDMQSKDGVFYSAEDADSEGVEGKFYVFSKKEVLDVLGEDEEFFCKHFNVVEDGNFEGKNILNLIHTDTNALDKEMEEKIERCRKKMFDYREARVHPFKDDKVLTSWNGLMIAALCIAGKAFENDEYVKTAERAIEFIMTKMFDDRGRLMARYRDGDVANLGLLDDYAFLVWGLIEAYEVTFKPYYLQKACKLTDDMIINFWDKEKGGFFLYGNAGENLFTRPKEIYDGATPSGNSIAAINLLRLSGITGSKEFIDKTEAQLNTFLGQVSDSPNYHTAFMSAVLYASTSSTDIVIVGYRNSKKTMEVIETINDTFLPFTTVVLNYGYSEIHELVPHTKEQKLNLEEPKIHVCKGGMCGLPISDIEKLKEVLKN